MERSITTKYPPKFKNDNEQLEYFINYRVCLYEYVQTLTSVKGSTRTRLEEEIERVTSRINALDMNIRVLQSVKEYNDFDIKEATIADYGKAG